MELNKIKAWGLFHVNSKTGEVQPYPFPENHNLSEEEAKRQAYEVRLGVGRGCATPTEWTTEARPETLVG